MVLSGQLQALAAFLQGKEPPVPTGQDWNRGWNKELVWRRKNLSP
jgi:hypothetical protein